MKFGKVDHPETVDFTIPKDHPETEVILQNSEPKSFEVYVGCAKWNKQDLKNFYPRGTKNELEYYASQFNSIELNATFYRNFPTTQFDKWYAAVPDDFRFFPKIMQRVSHLKRLNGIDDALEECLDGFVHLKEKLGTVFLQMHNNFAPKNFDRVQRFVELWPKEIPLAVEFRHTDWFNDTTVSEELYHLLQENGLGNIIVDTAGRRDLMHMRLTNDEAFVRYVGANHPTDYDRLDEWIDRIELWKAQGLSKLDFFIHQNIEESSPLLSAYFIEQLNKRLGLSLHIPQTLDNNNKNLFS
ncbi:Uncharacterized conserved protein YecE, DUF72 family [Pustulibacterium marinum]|uniref:Uncharacterized conserved protein YecE, DUF72 family n=1 Tax=Pustulibacterium marinum TaxID=1224947 RepID=A0A1I7I1Q1_9FLAO|nr:DUF72 domain-containing protein [Pustulibacterium marinum]SFU66676.1 Uncharacterized conserved protein YecE, DUF72 family [Pustulibacterium marinum]